MTTTYLPIDSSIPAEGHLVILDTNDLVPHIVKLFPTQEEANQACIILNDREAKPYLACNEEPPYSYYVIFNYNVSHFDNIQWSENPLYCISPASKYGVTDKAFCIADAIQALFFITFEEYVLLSDEADVHALAEGRRIATIQALEDYARDSWNEWLPIAEGPLNLHSQSYCRDPREDKDGVE